MTNKLRTWTDTIKVIKPNLFELTCYYCLTIFQSSDKTDRFCSNRCVKDKYGI